MSKYSLYFLLLTSAFGEKYFESGHLILDGAKQTLKSYI
jgi:hypothetical protein